MKSGSWRMNLTIWQRRYRNEAMNRSFVANVSHELKTPMTTIGGFVDGILDGTIPKEKHHQYLAIVSGEVKRLSRMVRSMLDLAKIEAGEMKLNPAEFDLNNIVCQVIFSFEQAIESKTWTSSGWMWIKLWSALTRI